MARRYVPSEPYPGVPRPDAIALTSLRPTSRGPPSRGSDASARREAPAEVEAEAEVEVVPAQEEPEAGQGGRQAEQVRPYTAPYIASVQPLYSLYIASI